MNIILANIRLIFQNPKYFLLYTILVIIFAVFWWFFTDLRLMRGNYGFGYYITDIIISWANILVFPLFIVAWLYRSYTFGSMGKTENIGFFGGIIGIIISGSMCCGSSLLLILGASSFTSFFSNYFLFGGLELKLIGVIILIIATIFLLKNLLTCSVKNSKK